MIGKPAKRKFPVFCKIISILAAFCILCGSFALANPPRTVKVAFFPMEGYHVLEPDGSYSGMDVDYLKALCQYTGWNIEYVLCESWNDALDKLYNHTVDLVGSTQYSASRAEIYSYADLSNGYTYGAIATNPDCLIAYEDFEAMRNITYGLVSGYVRTDEFYEYLANNGIHNPSIKEYPTSLALQSALDAGEIDALVHTFMELEQGQRLIGRFAPKPIYYITWKGNTELLNELNAGIVDLKISQPELETDLMTKYYESKQDKTVLLTTEEKEYIAQKQVLNVGYLIEHYPLSYTNENTGEFSGLTRKVLEDGLGWTGLQLNYIQFENKDAAYEALADGLIDVQAYCIQTDVEGIKFLAEYAHLPLVLVASEKVSFNDINTLATISGFSEMAVEITGLEHASLHYKNTQRDCLNMLSEGQVDAVLCDGHLAEGLLRTTLQYQNLKIINVLNLEHTVHMAVKQDANQTLERILTKTISNIDASDINEHTLTENVYPLMSLNIFIQNHSSIIVTGLIILILIIVAVAIRFILSGFRIQRLMYKDPSMDIWNMNYLYYMGEQKIQMERRDRFAVVCLNISKLRRYNVIYGWDAGQRLLEITKETLEKCIDEDREICARNYGDRFVIFLVWNDWDAFLERLSNMQQLIEALIFNNTETHMMIQMGVCKIPPSDVNLRDTVSYANQALEAAMSKGNFHSDIVVYDTSLETTLKERDEAERLLDSVDIPENFVAYYQSKVDIRTKKIIGAEALIRFKDPTANGMIRSPAYFISYYEQTGRIIEVDFFIMEATCKMLRERLDSGKSVVPISCNFSRLHFTKPGFAEHFEAILEKYGIDKELIEVEITETLIMEDLLQANIRATLKDLKARNIRLSIDDFGSGYSSLGTFEQIPASVVKLDRSFLHNNENHDRQIKVMRNIVHMAEDLDFQIVCEGVETEDDIKLMMDIHAYVAQGYFFSKPIPQDDFESKLDANE